MLGIPAGIVLALLSARTLSGFHYGVVAFDTLSFASAALLLLAAGAAAAVAPALRAGRVDPVRALRAE
jgi:ABC-type antimicrobial peptide transport system permease subunit